MLDLVLGRQDPSYQRRFAVGEKPFVCDAGEGRRLAVSITDEAGKVDLNAASDRLLQALLVGVGASKGLADAIIDYRDDDNSKRPQGAERDEYSAAGRPGPKNSPFSAVEEIEQVLGIDAELAARLRPHITIYPGQPGIDTGSASRELLAVLARGLGSDTSPAASGPPDQSGETNNMPPAMPFMGAQGRHFFAVHAEAYADSSAFVREAILELGRVAPGRTRSCAGIAASCVRATRHCRILASRPVPEPHALPSLEHHASLSIAIPAHRAPAKDRAGPAARL